MQQEGAKLYNWASVIDNGTLEQARVASSMPFIYPHLALMPDCHLGLGATVGSVIPTLGAIVPAAVGVDIGCGMIAVRTQFTETDLAGLDRKVLREQIERAIPLSAGNYNNKIQATAEPRLKVLRWQAYVDQFDPAKYAANWEQQLGTLGSGNHFIEVSLDEENRVWLFLHSGSRGVGNKIAQHHIKVAQDYCKKNWIQLPDPALAYLVEGTPEFDRYIAELRWAQHFALLNREEMMERVINQFQRWIGKDVVESQRVNCHHNYTVQATCFGKKVWLSRKGAIDANVGVMGLIPGSMGTRSYVVMGKGDKMSMCSAPHGAGREYSRNKAHDLFSAESLKAQMAAQGIEFNAEKAETFRDEAPGAYKPIDTVMDDARDLVEVVHTLRQIINVKGD
jgi:tRNA-splicing ligase RtcB